MRIAALLGALIVFNFLFWGGWYAVFGSPTGAMGYGALAVCLVLHRIGWHFLDRLIPKT